MKTEMRMLTRMVILLLIGILMVAASIYAHQHLFNYNQGIRSPH